jgi:hypothetical protein
VRSRPTSSVRLAGFTGHVITGDVAKDIEERLASLLGVEVKEIRDWVSGNVGASGSRRTGVRFVRGTHGGHYVRDPEGTDVLPRGVSLAA